MAKPYLIYKTSNGVYYAELLLPDGTHANQKSTGCRNRAEAEKVVMGWVVNGNIPSRINGKENHKTNVDKMSFFNNLRNYDFSSEEVLKIDKTLQDRKLLQFSVLPDTPQSQPIDGILKCSANQRSEKYSPWSRRWQFFALNGKMTQLVLQT